MSRETLIFNNFQYPLTASVFSVILNMTLNYGTKKGGENMRLDAHKTRVQLAINDLKRTDICRRGGIPKGTMNSAMSENRISENLARKIARIIGCGLDEIIKPE